MKTTVCLCLLALFFSGCSKDKFSSEPHISYKSISPNALYTNATTLDPNGDLILTLQLTDKEGDFGFKGKDSSYVFIKNITVPPFRIDSVPFPDLTNIQHNDLNAEISVNMNHVLASTPAGGSHTDTLFFEVYVVDFAKNKSNVIVTADPFFYITP